MESLRQYVITVTAAAIIAGILAGFMDEKSSSGGLIRLIAGLFLAFAVISPVVQLDWDGITASLSDFSAEGSLAAAEGENIASETYSSIIKSETEAYILDKAAELSAELEVEVTLDDGYVPAFVAIRGAVSPYAKLRLQQILEDDLGISKENQIWTG